eukprot:4904983-Pyramimonas_sp.AAC.1
MPVRGAAEFTLLMCRPWAEAEDTTLRGEPAMGTAARGTAAPAPNISSRTREICVSPERGQSLAAA